MPPSTRSARNEVTAPVETVGVATFPHACRAVEGGQVGAGALPSVNSAAGTVGDALDALVRGLDGRR